jgi:hypothetical protein
MISIGAKQFSRREIILGIGLIAVCCTAASAADSITGVVRNQTRGQFAAGAEVILLRSIQPGPAQPGVDQSAPQRSIQEEARTHTDAQGSFTFDIKYPNQPHIVRVVHRGVDYDQRASVGTAVFVNVFDAVPIVQGVTASIEIIRIGAQGNHLHVSDMIEIKNDSSPPLTQASERTYETYLPPRAKLDSVLAAGPGKIALLISAKPVPGEPMLYAVNFPLQPGATKFAFNYDLPYVGHAAFRVKNKYPLQQMAVMIPPTMKFASPSAAFHILRIGNDRYQVEAANLVRAGEVLAFEISGIGALPALPPQAQSQPRPPAAAPSIAGSSAGAKSEGHRNQASNALHPASAILAQLFRVQWVVLAVCTMMLGASVVLFCRAQFLSRATPKTLHTSLQKTGQAANSAESMVDALKGELRQLDIDRALSTITEEDYASARQVLEGTVKRALARAGQKLS